MSHSDEQTVRDALAGPPSHEWGQKLLAAETAFENILTELDALQTSATSLHRENERLWKHIDKLADRIIKTEKLA